MADLVNSALGAALLAITVDMEASARDQEDTSASAATATLFGLTTPSLASDGALPVKDAASLQVTINGVKLGDVDLEAISEVIVRQDVEAPSSFSVRFAGDDALARADSGTYDPGAVVTVSVGYTSVAPLITGEITGLEIELAGGDVPSLVVRGYDRRHRLLRGTRTDAYAGATDSAIAARIAQRNGLGFGGQDTSITYELVLQHEQTDLEFLMQRAARIGYEVVVDDTTLSFRPPALGSTGALTLSMDGDVTDFYARLSALSQPSEVHVRGWDPAQKKPIDEVATATDLASMGGTTGSAVAKAAFPTVTGTVTEVDQPVFTTDEAKAMARGQFDEAALGFIRGEGTCLGNAGLRAGTTLALQGLGGRFGGTYYVVSTEHTYTREQGYRTRFTVRRNATQAGSSGASTPIG